MKRLQRAATMGGMAACLLLGWAAGRWGAAPPAPAMPMAAAAQPPSVPPSVPTRAAPAGPAPVRAAVARLQTADAARHEAPRAPTGCDADEPPADPARFEKPLREGTADERRRALLQARTAGAELPESLLTHLVDNDASEAVRRLAFQALADAASNDASRTLALLEAHRWNASAAVRAEVARRRLTWDQAAATAPADDPQRPR